jgi:hypothetical protein
MRRVLMVTSAVALLVLLLAPAALAAGGRPLDRIPSRALASLGVPRIVTDGPLTVTGMVLTPTGGPAAGAKVEWGYYDSSSDWIYGNTTTTDAAGRYTFTGVTVTTKGTLDAYPADSYDAWGRDPVSFTAGAAAGAYDIAPGSVPFANTDQTGVNYSSIRVYTSGSGGYCRTTVTSQSAQLAAMPPDMDYAIVRYRDDYGVAMGGIEWMGGTLAISPSAVAVGQITVSEKAAHWIWIDSPYWASGAPGSKITLALDNWMTPMTASFYASPDWPNAANISYSGTFQGTSTGEAGFVTLQVPKTAKPGYSIFFYAYRTDPITANGGYSRFDVTASFEVCTLKASPARVARGGAVKLQGIVPTKGHWGSKAGLKKKITVYSRATATKLQPTDWNAKKGWKKLTDARTNGLGAYSLTVRPTKTTWYVVRYMGDDWYYGGYTAVLKVTVR